MARRNVPNETPLRNRRSSLFQRAAALSMAGERRSILVADPDERQTWRRRLSKAVCHDGA